MRCRISCRQSLARFAFQIGDVEGFHLIQRRRFALLFGGTAKHGVALAVEPLQQHVDGPVWRFPPVDVAEPKHMRFDIGRGSAGSSPGAQDAVSSNRSAAALSRSSCSR